MPPGCTVVGALSTPPVSVSEFALPMVSPATVTVGIAFRTTFDPPASVMNTRSFTPGSTSPVQFAASVHNWLPAPPSQQMPVVQAV